MGKFFFLLEISSNKKRFKELYLYGKNELEAHNIFLSFALFD